MIISFIVVLISTSYNILILLYIFICLSTVISRWLCVHIIISVYIFIVPIEQLPVSLRTLNFQNIAGNSISCDHTYIHINTHYEYIYIYNNIRNIHNISTFY